MAIMNTHNRHPVTRNATVNPVPPLLDRQEPKIARSKDSPSTSNLRESRVGRVLSLRHHQMKLLHGATESPIQFENKNNPRWSPVRMWDSQDTGESQVGCRNLGMRARMDSDTLPYDDRSRSRNSSTYSTDSAFSTNTTGTTISDIVEMYKSTTITNSSKIDLPNKGDFGRVIKPQAYRDTIIPLLQHRFSFSLPENAYEETFGKSSGSEHPEPFQQIHHHPGTTHEASSGTVPCFADFSRNLQRQKEKHKQPSSTNEKYQQLTPGMSRRKPGNPAKQSKEEPKNMSNMKKSQTEQRYQTIDASIVPPPLNIGRRSQFGQGLKIETMLDNPKALQNFIDDPYEWERYLSPRPSSQRGRRPVPQAGASTQRSISNPPNRLRRQHHNVVVEHHSNNDQMLSRQTGSTGSKRARLQKRDRRSQEDKDSQTNSSTVKRSASARRPTRDLPWPETRRNSLKHGMHAMVRRLSTPSSGSSKIPPVPQQPIQHLAVPFSPYQLYGPKVFEEEIKQELRDEKRRAKEDSKMEKARRSMEKKEASRHRRTISARSTSSIGSVFEGLKHSLTRSASERRREKLKASITLVGPTTLTAEHNAVAGMI